MRNLTLLTDLYELTMMYGYFRKGMHKNIVVFDVFFRQQKNGSSYALAAGLEQAIDYINGLRFDEDAYREAVRRHHRELGSCETGHAARDAAARIYFECTGKEPKPC